MSEYRSFINYSDHDKEKSIIVLKPNHEFLMWKLPQQLQPRRQLIYRRRTINAFMIFRQCFIEASGPFSKEILEQSSKAWKNADELVRLEYRNLAQKYNEHILASIKAILPKAILADMNLKRAKKPNSFTKFIFYNDDNDAQTPEVIGGKLLQPNRRILQVQLLNSKGEFFLLIITMNVMNRITKLPQQSYIINYKRM